MADLSVLIVDDHALFADALQSRLRGEPGIHPIHVAYTAADALAILGTHSVDVVLLDVSLGDTSGLELVGRIHGVAPRAHVIMLTGVESAGSVVPALRDGIRGWLSKTVDTDHLVEAVRGAVRGEIFLSPALLGLVLPDLLDPAANTTPDPLRGLTPREREVLQLLVEGRSRTEISQQLHVSANTVRTHTQNLLATLGVHSTLEAVALALRHGVRGSENRP